MSAEVEALKGFEVAFQSEIAESILNQNFDLAVKAVELSVEIWKRLNCHLKTNKCSWIYNRTLSARYSLSALWIAVSVGM